MADVSDPKIAEGMCLNPSNNILPFALTLLLQIAYEQIRSNGGEETWMLLDYEVRIQNNVVIIQVYVELTFFSSANVLLIVHYTCLVQTAR